MEFIEECLTSIDFEWRSKVRSLLVPECLVDPHCWDDSDFVGYGVVTSVSHHFDCAHDIWNCICCHQQASYWWWVDRISGFEFWILGPKRICQTFERQLVWLPEGTHRQGRWEDEDFFAKKNSMNGLGLTKNRNLWVVMSCLVHRWAETKNPASLLYIVDELLPS